MTNNTITLYSDHIKHCFISTAKVAINQSINQALKMKGSGCQWQIQGVALVFTDVEKRMCHIQLMNGQAGLLAYPGRGLEGRRVLIS